MKKCWKLALGADLRVMKNFKTSRLRIHFSIDDSLETESILIFLKHVRFTLQCSLKNIADTLRLHPTLLCCDKWGHPKNGWRPRRKQIIRTALNKPSAIRG